MSITAERRTTLIGEYATAPEDTGSPEVQVAILSERIVNLTDKAASKYLKVTLTLEFIDSKLKDPPKGGPAVLVQQTDFAAEMSPYSAIIDDALVSTLSSRASGDLIKLDGKDLLKADLITNVNHALHDEEKVVNVYFTSFIIQ